MKTKRATTLEAPVESQNRLSGIETESWLAPHQKLRLKKILVPVDFSDPSRKALEYAVSLAEEFSGEIILINVEAPYPILPEMPSATAQLTELLQKEAAARLEKWRAQIKDVPSRAVALIGSAAKTVVDFAAREEVDMIVLGTHGRTGLPHALLGSVAERIVRLASCPTLVVRTRERDFLVVPADDAAANRIGQTEPEAKKA